MNRINSNGVDRSRVGKVAKEILAFPIRHSKGVHPTLFMQPPCALCGRCVFTVQIRESEVEQKKR